MTYTHISEQWLPYPIETVFAFFANPENLPRLMPPWQKARIEEATFAPPPPYPEPGRILRGTVAGAGTRLTMSFRPFPYSPLRIPWEAKITEFVWNDHFCDTQVRGPFGAWNHCHYVGLETRDVPGTLLQDQVEYELPRGALFQIFHPLIAQQLKATFAFRHKRTAELLPLMAASMR